MIDRADHPDLWLERCLAIAVALAAAGNIAWLLIRGYLPQPFIYHLFDTFMDWFNTAYWAHSTEAYDNWGSIYPPLSFMFLSIFGNSRCYDADPVGARDCDWVGLATLFAAYILSLVAASWAFRRQDRTTALPRAIGFGLGLPVLYGLDRGQLALVCFPCFVLAHGPVARRGWVRWLAAAVSINFKPYLVVTLAAQIARRRWRAAEAILILAVLIYAVSWLWVGGGDPLTVVRNIVEFTATGNTGTWQDVYYSNSYNSLIGLISSSPATLWAIGSRLPEALLAVLPWIVRVGQGIAAAALLLAWARPSIASLARLTLLALGFAMITSETGGYSQMFLIFLVFLEPGRSPARRIAIVAAYINCLSCDYTLVVLMKVYEPSYLFTHYVEATYGLAVGQFVRPAMLLVIVYALGGETVLRFVREVRSSPGKPPLPSSAQVALA